MAGWYHRCHGHELGQTLGDGEGQGSLACCGPWVSRVRYDRVPEQQQVDLVDEAELCSQIRLTSEASTV